MKKIIFFIGPSSSGKDTFFARTLSIYDVLPIILLTTRPINLEKRMEENIILFPVR